MTSELIARWRSCPLDAPPYLLPGDEALLPSGRWAHPYRSFGEFVQSPAFGTNDAGLHLGLLPIPFLGDVLHASIYILLLNPGFAPDDYYAEEHSPEYRQALIRNLRQEHEGAAYPFFSLDPRFSWHAGFTYWHGRLGGIASALARQRNLSCQEALSEIARTTCAIELLPYHSTSFGLPPGLLDQLASVRLVQQFVHGVLVPRARTGEAVLIVTRSAKRWRLPEGENIVVYQGSETRGAYLGPNTRGGAAIMRRLELA